MFKFTHNTCSGPLPQRGAVLFVALVFLLVMTMIGVTAMRNTGQEENMAGGARDHNLAFQAAEAGLQFCLALVEPPATLPPLAASMTTAQTEGVDPGGFWTGYFGTSSNNYIYATNSQTPPTGTAALSNVAGQPRCVIEDMSGTDTNCLSNTSLTCYRITAIGVGGTLNAVAILQMRYYR
jgi:type IV pilus assembly protein PilX